MQREMSSGATDSLTYRRTGATDLALRELGRRRCGVSVLLALVLLAVWLGFVLIVAFGKSSLTGEIVPGFTVALASGLGVLMAAWLLACLYLFWAERHFDAALANVTQEPGR